MKILFFDVETKPVPAWIFRTGKQAISHKQLMRGYSFGIICICYKFLDDKRVRSLTIDFNTFDSTEMIAKFTKIVERADLVIGHNVDSFDIKHVNTQRLIDAQQPIAWPTSEDTLKALRKYFYFPSYRLDYITDTLFGDRKHQVNLQDWIDVVQHKKKSALKTLVDYCKKDVLLLEKMWKEISPWLKAKPAAASADTVIQCPRPECGLSNFHKKGKVMYRGYNRQRYQCQACGHVWHTLKRYGEQ